MFCCLKILDIQRLEEEDIQHEKELLVKDSLDAVNAEQSNEDVVRISTSKEHDRKFTSFSAASDKDLLSASDRVKRSRPGSTQNTRNSHKGDTISAATRSSTTESTKSPNGGSVRPDAPQTKRMRSVLQEQFRSLEGKLSSEIQTKATEAFRKKNEVAAEQNGRYIRYRVSRNFAAPVEDVLAAWNKDCVDVYEVLQVSPDISLGELKKVYRTRAMLVHPGKCMMQQQ